MQRKLPRFFLLSFLSFVFFSVVFQAIAYAQPAVQNTLATSIQQPLVPTPTIYMPSTVPMTTVKPSPQLHAAIAITIPSPTPTIYIAPPQPTDPPATPTPTVPVQQTYATVDIPAISPTVEVPTISPTVTPVPTASSTTVDTTQPSSTELDSFFSQFSSLYNVSEDELKKIAECESGFNTTSNTGTYAGMYQFLASTWESERNVMGLDPNPDLRMDAQEAIHTAAFMLSRGGEDAWPNCH